MVQISVFFLVVQIAKKCNESARDLENRELLNEISKNLVFKKVKVSNAFRVRYLCRLYTVMDFLNSSFSSRGKSWKTVSRS